MAMVRCPSCGSNCFSHERNCPECGAALHQSPTESTGQINPSVEGSRNELLSPEFLISALKACAWIALVAGVLGGIYMWINAPDFDGVLRGLRIQYLSNTLSLPIEGFVVWVLFNVVAMMAENLIAIREQLSHRNK